MHASTTRPLQDWAHFEPGRVPGVTLMQAHFREHAFERHSHETYAIGLTLAGVQAFHCRGTRHASLPGDVILFNPDEAHDGQRGSDEGFGYAILYVEPSAMQGCLDLDAGTGAGRHFRQPVVHDAPAGRVLARAIAALGQPQESLRAQTLVCNALTGLLRRHGESADAGHLREAGRARMRGVREYIEARCDEDVTVEQLAAEAGLSRAHLTRAFTQAWGVSPHVYLNAARLRRARQALLNGEPLAAAATASGFADQSHFTRRFKGAFGLSPGAWLRQVSGTARCAEARDGTTTPASGR